MITAKAKRSKTILPFATTKVFWMVVKLWKTHDVIVMQGGTSSGKTYAILQWLILKGAEKKQTITVVGQDVPNLKVGALRDFKTILSSSQEVDSWFTKKLEGTREYTMFNGTVIEFKSYSDAQDAKSGKRDILFVNEANGIAKDIYDELHDRTSGKTILDYNPTAKFWVHSQLMGTEGVVRCISNFTHNRFCPRSIVKKLLSYRTKNPFRWKVYGLGQTGQVEGVIYPNVTFISRSELPPEADMRRFGYGSDYGFSNDPFTLVRAGVWQGKIYAEGLIYETGLRLSNPPESPEGTPSSIVDKLHENNVDQMDVIAFDDSQAKEQAMLLEEDHGFNVKAARRTGGSILSGIGLLQDYEICIVDDANGNWKTEQENYQWKVVRGVKSRIPVDKFNHYWDALRYWGLEMLTDTPVEEYRDETFTI